MRIAFQILLLLVCIVNVNAQSHYFRHYEVENGLSNNTVFCSVQDKDGFMWFGTKDGLNRFDGYRFKTFNITNNNPGSLSRDLISSLVVDKKGQLWVGSEKGLFWFDAQTEKLIPFLDSIPAVNDLMIDRQGQLWLISGPNLCRYDFNKKVLTTFPASQYFNATSFCETEDGAIWVSSFDGYLNQLDKTRDTFTRYNVFTNSATASSSWIEKIIADKNGSIYVGTPSQGIKQFDLATKSYKDILTYNDDRTTVYVRDILKASDHEIWFATESGIFVLDKSNNSFLNLKKKFLDPYSLSDNAVYTLCKDNEGGIWAGTYFGGLNYYPKQYFAFQKFFPDYSGNSISGSAVREICEDNNGNLWIGTEDAGISKLNTATKAIKHFLPTGKSTGIANSNVHGLLVVASDLWIGTFEHGLDILDRKTDKVRKHYNAGPGPNDLKSNFIVSLLQSKRGDIYIGTSNGLFRYNPGTDNFSPVTQLPPGGFISCLMEDHQGTIWVGSHGSGAFFFNPDTGDKGHLQNEPGNKNSLTTNIINALYQDSDNRLWFATEGGGLCQLSKDKKSFQRYSTTEGLPSNFIFKVLEDSEKMLWITTSKGLASMPIQGGSMTTYTKANGLLNDQFNYNSGYKDKEGRLYFGSVRGMITFNPASFYKSKFIPPLFFTGFQVHNKEVEIGGKSVLKNTILHTDKITLPYDQSSFSIDFAAISYTSPERTEYSYKMEGIDKEWNLIKSNRKVYFTNLKPGSYVFKLKASGTGFEGTHEKNLAIKILPPFWATRWAYFIYVAAVTGLLYYLVRVYHNMQENKKAKEIYEAKIEFFTNIAHEIKTPLTLIKGPVENLTEMVTAVPAIKEDVVTMERNTNRLVNLVNQILDFRQTETKGFSLNFTNVNINEILQEAFLTFEPLARKKKLDYTMSLPAEDVYTLADDEALNKIFSNLFSNAVKYADHKVAIRLLRPSAGEQFLVIEIRNDGTLIPEEMKEKIFEPFVRLKEATRQKGTGIGLALARSLVELHKGKLFLDKPEEDMNVFVMTVPFLPNADKKKMRTETNEQIIHS